MFRKLAKHDPKTIEECLVSVEKTLRRGGYSENKIQDELRDIELNYQAAVEAYSATGIAADEAVLRALEECAPLLSLEVSQNKLIRTLCFGFFFPRDSLVGIHCIISPLILAIIYEYIFCLEVLGQNYLWQSQTDTLVCVSFSLFASILKSGRLAERNVRDHQRLPRILGRCMEVDLLNTNNISTQIFTTCLLLQLIIALNIMVFTIIVICLIASHQLLLAVNVPFIPLLILSLCLGYVYPGFVAYALDYTFAKPLSRFLVATCGVIGLECVVQTAIRTDSDSLEHDPG